MDAVTRAVTAPELPRDSRDGGAGVRSQSQCPPELLRGAPRTPCSPPPALQTEGGIKAVTAGFLSLTTRAVPSPQPGGILSAPPVCAQRKVPGKPLSSGRLCPKAEAADPVLYPVRTVFLPYIRMKQRAISAESQKPVNPWLPAEARGRARCGLRARGLQQQRAVTAMFGILQGVQGLALACFQTASAPCKAGFILMLAFRSLVPLLPESINSAVVYKRWPYMGDFRA